jgi:signal peptidase I
MAQNSDKNNQVDKRGTWSSGMGSLLVAVLVALAIRWCLIEAYVIPSGSMLPTLLIQDHIWSPSSLFKTVVGEISTTRKRGSYCF